MATLSLLGRSNSVYASLLEPVKDFLSVVGGTPANSSEVVTPGKLLLEKSKKGPLENAEKLIFSGVHENDNR